MEQSQWNNVLRGMALPWRVTDKNLQGVQDMEVRDSDVFIVSYPKSGTNWLRNIVGCMLDCPIEQTNMSLILEASMSTGASPEEVESAPVAYETVRTWSSPRVMYTHLLPHLLPSDLFAKKAKILYMCRNPKDVAVSYHFFRQTVRTRGLDLSLDEHIEQFLTGQVPFGSYFDHVKQYLKMRERSNFLLVKYEDLKKNQNAIMKDIGTFLGLDLDDSKISEISRQCSVQRLREKFTGTSQAIGIILDKNKGQFVRKGEVGSWQEVLSEAQNRRFDDLFSEHFEGTGFTIDFV